MPHKDPAVRKAYQRKRWLNMSPEQKEKELERLAAWNADPENRKKSQSKYYYEGGGKAKQLAWSRKNRDRLNKRARQNYAENRDEINARDKERRAERRAALLKLLGTKCARCGFDNNVRALQFDHINDDGAADRRRFKTQDSMYHYYLRHPDEAKARLQVLCANCNHVKESETEFGHRARRP